MKLPSAACMIASRPTTAPNGITYPNGTRFVIGEDYGWDNKPNVGLRLTSKEVAERLKEKGVTRVVFDRNGFLYHGRVKAVADSAREAGLEF